MFESNSKQSKAGTGVGMKGRSRFPAETFKEGLIKWQVVSNVERQKFAKIQRVNGTAKDAELCRDKGKLTVQE